jgi:hypothetical protein
MARKPKSGWSAERCIRWWAQPGSNLWLLTCEACPNRRGTSPAVAWIPRWRRRTSTRPGRGKGDLQAGPPGGAAGEPADHGLSRSRGGLSTKVHLACEQRQKPLSVVITAGQRGDSPQFQAVLGRIRVPRTGPGHLRTRPDRVLADKAYGSRANRAYLRRRGIACTIPEKAGQVRNRKNKGRAGGRPPALTPGCTSSATQWNAGSPGSSVTGPWPPATTSSPSATRPPSTSPRSTNGCSPTS